MASRFFGEFMGTLILILLGNDIALVSPVVYKHH